MISKNLLLNRALPAILAGAVVLAVSARAGSEGSAKSEATAKPSLAVTTVKPVRRPLDQRLSANGNIAAWQEASLGAEVNGLRLAEIRADAGDRVQRGQVLASFASDLPQAELAQAKAALLEAEALARDAAANGERARAVQGSGALSAQQLGQYLTSEATAQARLQVAQANLAVAELRLRHTQVLASDDGILSWRSPQTTLGAVLPQGQELFRLIRQGRLEWRGEVVAAELARLRPKQAVTVKGAHGGVSQGWVRRIAPIVDVQTRNALVYVDLPASAFREGGFRPGMFARGEFLLGRREALTVPRQALVARDGFHYVFLFGADGKVRQTKVAIGSQEGEIVEITAGLPADAVLVASGAGFLNDGDLVKQVNPASAQ